MHKENLRLALLIAFFEGFLTKKECDEVMEIFDSCGDMMTYLFKNTGYSADYPVGVSFDSDVQQEFMAKWERAWNALYKCTSYAQTENKQQ
jgi:hypothetical protein